KGFRRLKACKQLPVLAAALKAHHAKHVQLEATSEAAEPPSPATPLDVLFGRSVGAIRSNGRCMTIRYHVTVDRQGDEWWAVCPALRHHGPAIGGETREEALVHIENAILMILKEMASNGVPPPPDQMPPY